MAISYNKLWKLLVDKKMSKADLRKAAGIAPNTMTRLRRDEEVTLAVLNKICVTLEVDIGDIMEFLPDYDAVLLENHGALSYGDSLLSAYHKMESVEFYARLMYQTKMIGGAQILPPERVEQLYDIRRNMNIGGKHPCLKK